MPEALTMSQSVCSRDHACSCYHAHLSLVTMPAAVTRPSHPLVQDGQLQPEALEAANEGKVALQSRLHDGYDHSYFFIASFIEEHLRFHARALGL